MNETIRERCQRCNGCGRVTGSGQTERPWTRFGGEPTHRTLEKILGIERARDCPECHGEGWQSVLA